jgi:hypothetical protein
MLKTGARLRSQACTTEVIVVRAGSSDDTLHCGGHPMLELSESPAEGFTIDENFKGGTQLGKRYIDAGNTIEVLVTKPGEGSVALGDTPLELKTAKPLPSSD